MESGYRIYIPIRTETYVQDYSAWILAKSGEDAIIAQRFHFALRAQSSSDIVYECVGIDAHGSLSLSPDGKLIDPILLFKN